MKENTTPLTVIYRGTVEDTAILIGLACMRINVGMIAFTGEMTNDMKSYCRVLNQWLLKKGLPQISIHPSMTEKNLKNLIDCPLKAWGWRSQECLAAIHLAGLTCPPISKVS